MAVVTLTTVTKEFCSKRHRVRAVDGLSLSIGDGELVTLVGPSGCGKTTLLRLIAGLEEVTDGIVEIGGCAVTNRPPKDRDVAMVFQDFALYPHLCVFDNMAFGLKMRRTPKVEIRRRVGETASLLGIELLLKRRPHELSGGEQQRVAFGRAIVRRPRICLFDEPLANLDAPLRGQMRFELKRLQRELDMTTLYVTHDQQEALALGDRVAVMAGGRLQQVGAPGEVYGRPSNRFVAGFVGSPGMNLLEGRMSAENGCMVIDLGTERVRLSGRLSALGRGLDGVPMVLGVRPERVALGGPGGENMIAVRVLTTETCGDRTDVYCEMTDGRRLVSRATVGVVRDGDSTTATLDVDGACLFEPGDFGVNVATAARRCESDEA